MFTDLLPHQVEVYRRSGRTDRFGQPVDANPSQAGSPISQYRCRLTRGSGGQVNQERSLDVFESAHQLFIEPYADIHEDDTLRVLDPLSGDELLPLSKISQKNLVYDSVGPHHLEIKVKVQRGPQ